MSFLHEKCEKQISDLNNQINKIQKSIDNYKKKNKDLTKKKKDLEKINSKLKKDYKNLIDTKNKLASVDKKALAKLAAEISPADTRIIEILSTVADLNIQNHKLPKIQSKLLIQDIGDDISQIISDFPNKLNNDLNGILINPAVIEILSQDSSEIDLGLRHRTLRGRINYINYFFESKYKGSFEDCCSAITNLCIKLFQKQTKQDELLQMARKVNAIRGRYRNEPPVYNRKVSIIKSIKSENYHEIHISMELMNPRSLGGRGIAF